MAIYLQTQIETGHFPLRCPEESCKVELAEGDARACLSPELFSKYETLAFNQAIDKDKDFSWCPTPDCKFAFVFDEKTADCQLKCPVCERHYCLSCRVAYHEGITCEEYQRNHVLSENDKEFVAYAQGQKFKQCPKCNFWVERTMGCDCMTCRCG